MLILNIVVILTMQRIVCNVFHPVSELRISLETKIGSQLTIRGAHNWTLSNLSESCTEQPSHTTEAYSRVGLIFFIYILERCSLPNFKLKFF